MSNSAYFAALWVNGPSCSAKMCLSSSSTNFCIVYLKFVMIDCLDMDELTVGAGSYLLIGMNEKLSVFEPRASFRLSSSSCTASLQSSARRKAVRRCCFDQLCMMPTVLLVIDASSGMDTCDPGLWLSWLLDGFSEFSSHGVGLDAWFLYRCASNILKVAKS